MRHRGWCLRDWPLLGAELRLSQGSQPQKGAEGAEVSGQHIWGVKPMRKDVGQPGENGNCDAAGETKARIGAF